MANIIKKICSGEIVITFNVIDYSKPKNYKKLQKKQKWCVDWNELNKFRITI